jgi:hypothetical protein
MAQHGLDFKFVINKKRQIVEKEQFGVFFIVFCIPKNCNL